MTPLIWWNFDNTTANIDYELSLLGYDGYFDISLYHNNTLKSDPFDSSNGAYLDGHGHLICGGDATVADQEYATSNELISLNISAPRTFEVWAYNTDLTTTGGGFMSIDGTYYHGNGDTSNYTHDHFDGLVWSESGTYQYRSGSELWNRGGKFTGPAETNDQSYMHLVLVYDSDGGIRFYRNGTQYGDTIYYGGIEQFAINTTKFTFCHRHQGTTANPFNITYAAYYDKALSEIEIQALYCHTFIPSGEADQYYSQVLDFCTTDSPSQVPTFVPTIVPSHLPTTQPSKMPSNLPTTEPSSMPTSVPTVVPTNFPTSFPTVTNPIGV